MTRPEFACVVAYLVTATGKVMPFAQMEVFFDLLGDLPARAVEDAARRAVASSPYPAIPPVGVLRALALEATRPTALTWGEAWGLVLAAVRRFGWDREREALASLPDAVARAARCMGWERLCAAAPEHAHANRSQFRDVYTPIVEREQRAAALPPPSRALLAGIGRPVPQLGVS